MTVKRIVRILELFISKINVQLINDITGYLLVVFLWAPHGAKECIHTADACAASGPNFVAPMIFTFLAPNWVMDMSSQGWGMQILFAPPLLIVMYLIVRLAKNAKYGKIFQIYAVRWGLMWGAVLAYYNFVFWYGPLRQYVFPLFTFTSEVFK